MSSNKEGKGGKTLGEELASAAETSEEGAGDKRKRRKKGGSKKKLLLLPVIGLLVAALAVFVLKRFGGPTEKAGREVFLRRANSAAESSGEEAVPLKAVRRAAQKKKEPESMTVAESIDYIEAMTPKSLGLEGNIMEEYEVLPMAGTVLVDGLPCTEVDVYRQDDRTGTNVFQGSYLLDRSGRALYELDRDNGTVQPIQPMKGDNG